MANKVFVGSGALTTAANWANVDSTALVSNNVGSTALTTGNLDATGFTPGAVTVLGVLVRLSARAAGTPTNTVTVTLRNVTGAVNVVSVTANVSDLPACTTGATSEGGWHYFKFSAAQLLLAATSYTIRMTLSSTSTAVSFATNGTANNWQHMLVLNTTGAPAAGDDMHGAQLLDGSTNPATPGTFGVTMDSVAATDYGSADTSNYVGAFTVSKGVTVSYGVAAATNYVLRLSGHLKIFEGGVFQMGTAGVPCPTDSTMVLEFDCGADWAFYINCNGGTFRGIDQPRTPGTAVSRARTTASIAISDATINIDRVTGWLAGDEVYIGTSNRTVGSSESKILNANAGASSFVVTVAMANAHPYSAAEVVDAPVVLLTRRVQVRSVSTTFMTGLVARATGHVDCEWVSFRYCGANNGPIGDYAIQLATTTGTVVMRHCVVRDSDEGALWLSGTVTTGGSVIIEDCIGARLGVTNSGNGFVMLANPTAAGLVSIADCSVVHAVNTMTAFYLDGLPNVAITGDFWVSGVVTGLRIEGDWDGATIPANWTMHSGSGDNLLANAGAWLNCTMSGVLRLYRQNAGAGIRFSTGVRYVRFSGTVYCFGNTDAGVECDNSVVIIGIQFDDLRVYGETSFSQGRGIWLGTGVVIDFVVLNLDSGTASGLWTTHVTADIEHDGSLQGLFRNARLASATELIPTTPAADRVTVRQFQRKDAPGTDFTQTWFGEVAREVSTVQDSPGLKLTPYLAAHKLDSAARLLGRGFLVGILNGGTVQVSVYVRKNGAYNGNAPRLIQKGNAAVGLAGDVVLDTLSVAADTWEILTGTTAAADADGVVEFVVDCDGTAGAVFVNQWADGAVPAGDETAWFDGLPMKARGVSVIGSGGGEQAYGYVG